MNSCIGLAGGRGRGENVHRSDEESHLNTRLKKACLTAWGFQLGTHAGWTARDRQRAVCEQPSAGEQLWLCREYNVRGHFHNPHCCIRTSLSRLSSGQPATWTVGIFFAPDVFCVKSYWMWLGSLGVVGLCFILGFGIFFLSKRENEFMHA